MLRLDPKQGARNARGYDAHSLAPKPPAPPKPRFSASLMADGSTLEILVYGEIIDDQSIAMYEAYGVDTSGMVSSGAIKRAIDGAGAYSKITVRINSPGGDGFEGIAAYNILRAQGKPVDVYVDSVAASSASIIAMAGDTITMGVNCLMMIHNCWSIVVGNATDMRSMADLLDKISVAIGATYVQRTKKSVKEIKSLMDAETWMSAEDCIENGFATHIAERPDDQSAEALAMARGFKAFARMKNLPAVLKLDRTVSENAIAQPSAITIDKAGQLIVGETYTANVVLKALHQEPIPEAEGDPLIIGEPYESSVIDTKDIITTPVILPNATVATETPVKNENSNGCDCVCGNCVTNNCDQCTEIGCNQVDCIDCPMQLGGASAESNLSLYQARLVQLRHGIKAPNDACSQTASSERNSPCSYWTDQRLIDAVLLCDKMQRPDAESRTVILDVSGEWNSRHPESPWNPEKELTV